MHCVKSIRIQSYFGPYFPAFGLNTERYEVSLRIQSECGKIRTRITPNTDTFYAVMIPFLRDIYLWAFIVAINLMREKRQIKANEIPVFLVLANDFSVQ